MKTDKPSHGEWEPTISYADVAARFPSHAWEVVDKKGNEYRIERVAPTMDDTLVIWVVPIDTPSENAPENKQGK